MTWYIAVLSHLIIALATYGGIKWYWRQFPERK